MHTHPRCTILLVWFLFGTLEIIAQSPEPLGEKWLSQFSGPSLRQDYPTAIACDSAGDVYVAGIITTPTAFRGVVLKFAAGTGTPLWRWESTSAIIPDDDPDYSFPGDARIAVAPDGRPIALFRRGNQLVKLRAEDGSEVWSVPTTRDGPTGYPSTLDYEMTVDAVGDICAVGAGTNGIVGKFSGTDGAFLWSYQPAGLTSTMARAVAANAAGDVFITGVARAGPSPQPDLTFTARLNGMTGSVQWTKSDPGATSGLNSSGRVIQIDSKGDVVVATFSSRLFKYRGTDGSTVWQQSFSGAPYDLVTDSADDVYLATDLKCQKFAAATGVSFWNVGNSSMAPMTILIRGNELIAMGHLNGKFTLHAFGLQYGDLRWFQLRDSGVSTTRVVNKALTLMAPQGSDRIVYTGAVWGSGNYDIAVASHGPGPSISPPTKNWVLPTRAQLRVNASGNGRVGTIYCEYGLTTAYGQTLPLQNLTTNIVPPGPSYTFTLEGLAENTVYHARFVGTTDRGTTATADFTFTTEWDANRDGLPDEWELAHWGNTVFRSAKGDEDKDGLPALMEYAIGRDPRVPDSANALSLAFDENDRLSITLPKRPHASLRAEVCGDLKTWIPGEVAREDDTTITFRDVVPRNGTGARFLRVRATSQ